MLGAYWESLQQAWPWACVAAALSLLGAGLRLERLGRLPARAVHRVGLGMAVLLGLCWAWRLRWLCDDAFISFRYAANLARGQGPVFNPGERVEGYTNFLWMLIVAGAEWLGLQAPQASVVLGLACFAGLIALTARVATLYRPFAEAASGPDRRSPSLATAVPIGAGVVALNYLAASFGTSGLESMFAATLVLLALERASVGALLGAGTAAIGATLAHPDHAVFYVSLGVALLVRRESLGGLVRYAAPFALLYVPYFLWRYSYYGDFFPNTYYAKLGGASYYSQGLTYLVAFAVANSLFLAAPVVLYGVYLARRSLLATFFVIAAPLFSLYVARLGGDFMLGRLLLPLLAPMVVLGELGARGLLRWRRPVWGAVGLLLLTSMAWPITLLRPRQMRWHLADERTFYELTSFSPVVVDSPYFRQAQAYREHLSTPDYVPSAAFPGVGLLGYYTNAFIVDLFGLVDRHIARQPVTRRGRPGHEKLGSPAYLLERGVELTMLDPYPAEYTPQTRFELGETTYFVGRFTPRLLARLKALRGAAPQHIERDIDRFVASQAVDRVETACDAWFYEEAYFSGHPRSLRRPRVRQRLIQAGAPVGWPTDANGTAKGFPRGYVVDPSTRIGFEPAEWKSFRVAGNAFASGAVEGAVGGQVDLKGHRGALANSFGAAAGDGATGTLETRPFPLRDDLLELWVGGGRLADEVRGSLFVDGREVHWATGCNSEALGRRLWDIAPFRGKQGVLRLEDASAASWGHLLVDEVVQWRRRNEPSHLQRR